MKSIKLMSVVVGVIFLSNVAWSENKSAVKSSSQLANKPSTVTSQAPAVANSQTLTEKAESALPANEEKLSYIIGANLGLNAKRQGLQINMQMLAKGFTDVQQGNKLMMNEQEMRTTWDQYQQQQMAKFTRDFQETADNNKRKGEAFLAENKGKEGVVSLDSGLQYKIVTAGTGEKPVATDTVEVEYTGRTVDGKVFDSTEKRGKPEHFQVGSVIPGWTEILQLMPVGSTWEVYIPSKLAYGERGVGGPIGPNETLIFTIHLLGIDKQQPQSSLPKGNKHQSADNSYGSSDSDKSGSDFDSGSDSKSDSKSDSGTNSSSDQNSQTNENTSSSEGSEPEKK